jgi:hypothetical protein
MQHVDPLGELCDIHEPICATYAHPNLDNARADGRHGLPISRHLTELNPPKIEAELAPDGVGQVAQIVARRSNPVEWLGVHYTIYKVLYTGSMIVASGS